ncbi:MAG: hypothetical protein Q8K98_06360 [Bacteroidota bacterium]|nr:hypothetical protein [Bacteroidota bacterium]
MARSYLHISLTIVFTLVFLIFNIGLPVVLHYCEMMKTVSSDSCGMCDTEKNNHNDLALSKGESSCCQTVIAAESNKVEFLQTQKNEVAKLQHSITPSAIGGLHSFTYDDSLIASQSLFLTFHSPPSNQDIPVFNSSLLI